MTRSLERGRLGELVRIAEGGQGTVFDALAVTLSRTGLAVYKEYHPHVLPTVDFSVLERMIQFLEQLPFAEGSQLVGWAAWPTALVTVNGTPTGFLMPRVPDDFHINFKLPSGRVKTKLGAVQDLLNPDTFLTARGISLTDCGRYLLLADTVTALAYLHDHNIAVGDLSAKNVLYSLTPRHRCYFVDCDAMRIDGRSAMPQCETPDWDAPTTERRATPPTDIYKLALLTLRLFARSQTTRNPVHLPATTPPAIRNLIRAGLTLPPNKRPAAEKWTRPLALAATTSHTPPAPLQAPLAVDRTRDQRAAQEEAAEKAEREQQRQERRRQRNTRPAGSRRTDRRLLRYALIAVLTAVVPYVLGHFVWRPSFHKVIWPADIWKLYPWASVVPELVAGAAMVVGVLGLGLLRPTTTAWRGRTAPVVGGVLLVAIGGGAFFYADRLADDLDQNAQHAYAYDPVPTDVIGDICGTSWRSTGTSSPARAWAITSGKGGSCTALVSYTGWSQTWHDPAYPGMTYGALGSYRSTLIATLESNGDARAVIGIRGSDGKIIWLYRCPGSGSSMTVSFDGQDGSAPATPVHGRTKYVSVTCNNGNITHLAPDSGKGI